MKKDCMTGNEPMPLNRKRGIWWAFLFWMLTAFPIFAGEPKSSFPVKYLSSDHVYLSGGSADGLKVGDGLLIMDKGRIKAALEVDYVAEHSASCTVLQKEGEIRAGDLANAAEEMGSSDAPQVPVKKDPAPPVPKSPAVRPRTSAGTRLASVSGSVSALVYRWNDNTPNGLDFTQSTLRMNLRARRLWGEDITFTFRARGRYDQRGRAYSSSVPQNEWINNVGELSLAYEDETAPINIYAGRILPRRISSTGYVDGLLIENRLSGTLRAGAFAGVQPDWMYTDISVPLQKGGAYMNYTKGTFNATRLELTLAGAGEYHAFNVSRELLYSQAFLSYGNRWSFGQTAEVDFNRRWRKEKMGGLFSLTSLYAFGRCRLSDRLSASLNYDNSKNYWTYEIQNIVDSLFDRNLRQGMRMQLDFNAGARLFGFVGGGVRKRSGDPAATYSYSTGVSKNGFFLPRCNIDFQVAGFSGPFDHGFNFSTRAGKYLRTSDYVSLGYGLYAYRNSGFTAGPRRSNHWVELALRADLAARLSFSSQLQYNTGDDIRGTRLQGELGYFF